MHRKRRLQQIRVHAQSVNFRLAPLIKFQELATEPQTTKLVCISDANTWTATGQFGRLPNIQERASTRQTWLKILSTPALQTRRTMTPLTPLRKQSTNSYTINDSSIPLPVLKGKMSTERFAIRRPTIQSPSRLKSNDESISLPVLKRRMPTERFLIRRPTIQSPSRLKSNDTMFDALAKHIEFRVIHFKKIFEYYLFYDRHFPLLMTRVCLVDNVSRALPDQRARTPWSPMSILISRKRALEKRIHVLDLKLYKLTRENEGLVFATELYSPIFYPNKWPWNKVDVKGLIGRYISEAALNI